MHDENVTKTCAARLKFKKLPVALQSSQTNYVKQGVHLFYLPHSVAFAGAQNLSASVPP